MNWKGHLLCRQLEKFKPQDLVAALHALALLGSTFDADVAQLAVRLVSIRSAGLHADELVSLLWYTPFLGRHCSLC